MNDQRAKTITRPSLGQHPTSDILSESIWKCTPSHRHTQILPCPHPSIASPAPASPFISDFPPIFHFYSSPGPSFQSQPSPLPSSWVAHLCHVLSISIRTSTLGNPSYSRRALHYHGRGRNWSYYNYYRRERTVGEKRPLRMVQTLLWRSYMQRHGVLRSWTMTRR